MGLTVNIALNLYSIVILLILYLHAHKKAGIRSLKNRLFIHVLWVTALLLVVDIMGRLDGRPDTYYPLLNSVGNFLLYLLNPVLPSIWLLYAHAHLYQNEKMTKRLLLPCGIVFAAHTALLIISQFTGWIYSIDAQNIYHRGPLFMVSVSTVVGFLLSSVVMLVKNRRWIERKQLNSLLFFAAPSFAFTLLQYIFPGISFVLNGVVLSTLIVFLNIQNRSLVTDYLTGVYNRKGFDMLLMEKIKASTLSRTFSAILLDFDHFKAINDTYGHGMGDKALQKSVELLKDCVRSTDFIARFGGDEFAILLDTSDRRELEAVVRRINAATEEFNKHGGQHFSIGFSAGYAVYDASAQAGPEAFLKQLDQMMYQMKQG